MTDTFYLNNFECQLYIKIYRETEWLFSTPEGRKKLLGSAKYNRLAIVSMHRGQIYTTWDDVKYELSDSIRNLAPNGVKDDVRFSCKVQNIKFA